MKVFFERRSHRGTTPVGEVELLPTGSLFVQSNTTTFIKYIKALWGKPMCDKVISGDSTEKCPTQFKFKTMLKHVERPYFFAEHSESRWLLSEVIHA